MKNHNLELSEKLKSTYPGFKVGYLSVSILDNKDNQNITTAINELSHSLKSKKDSLLNITKGMAQFYHVLGAKREYHISSLINATLNGRKYKSINPAVDLVYLIELNHGVLMGLHDLSTLEQTTVVDTTIGNETIEHISKLKLPVEKSDIVFRNAGKIISSLTGGPDDATKVTSASSDLIIFAFGCPSDSERLLEDALTDCRQRFVDFLKAEIGSTGIVTA